MEEPEFRETSCDYCGLPTGFTKPVREPVYCCFGCRFAAAVAAERGAEGHARWTLTRLGLAIFFSMNVMVFTIFLWTQDVYAGSPHVAEGALLHDLFRYGCLLFTAPVLLLLGGPLLENSLESLRRGRITIDPLIVLGVAAATLYSLVSTVRGSGHTYFEVACMVLVAVTLGRWLEAMGKLRATESLDRLARLLPQQVRRLEPDGGESLVDLAGVQPPQQVRVIAGERIPVDGRIADGRASVDEQLLSGESRPVVKQTGDSVSAGTLNLDGQLIITATTPADAGAVHRLIEAVNRVSRGKSRVQRLADRVAAWFLPAVVLIALLTFAMQAWLVDLPTALMAALAVVLIACPCALGVATPLAIWAAVGRAAQAQVLFRDGEAISQLAQTKAICFDKTGTLTSGQVDVINLAWDPETPRQTVLRAAQALASASTHGLSVAIRRYTRTQEVPPYPQNLRLLAGRGIAANVDGIEEEVFLGSLRLMEEANLARCDALRRAIVDIKQSEQPLACIGWGGRVRGVFVFQEQLRDQSQAALQQLREMGLRLSMLTGDHAGRSRVVEQQLGIDAEAELLPEDKLAAIARCQTQFGKVAMVGDGLNDAPALAAADVGIAMGCGADVSREAADVCLLGDHLDRLAWAIQLAQETMRTARQNLFWAFGYNTVGIAVAAAGWLNPIIAAAAMVVSSLLVVGNSLKLTTLAGPDPSTPAPDKPPPSSAAEATMPDIRPQAAPTAGDVVEIV